MTFLIFDCMSYRLVRVPDEQIVNDDHYSKSAEHRSKVNSGLPIKYTIVTICIIHGDRRRLTPVLYREEIDTKAKAIPTVARTTTDPYSHLDLCVFPNQYRIASMMRRQPPAMKKYKKTVVNTEISVRNVSDSDVKAFSASFGTSTLKFSKRNTSSLRTISLNISST